MSSAGRKLLSRVVRTGDINKFVGLGVVPEMFNGGELQLYEFIKGHLLSHGVLPSESTVVDKLGEALVESPEPESYYLSELQKRFLQTQIKKLWVDSKVLLDQQDPDAAFDLLLNRVSELNAAKRKHDLLDFRDVAQLIHQEYIKQKSMGDDYAMKFGWPTLDNITGGLRSSDFGAIVGRPGRGKTFLGLSVAEYHWENGGSPLFVSMEMSLVSLSQRLAAMKSHKPLTQVLKGLLTTKAYTGLMADLSALKSVDRPFWIIDGNLAATGEEIVMHCQQLHPSAVVIDGGYLVKSNNPKATRWDRITESAELFKQRIATDLGIPTLASYQFNRGDTKKKKTVSETSGLDDIYGSDAIGQLASVVLGLFEEESIETQVRRRVDILKGRNGETGKFLLNWDFQNMDFSEIPTVLDAQGNIVESTENLQFIG